jgi:hypothetical protein
MSSIQKDGVQGFEQYAVGEDAARIFALAQGGTLTAPVAGIAHSIYRPDSRFDDTPTYARKFTAGAEHLLDADTTITIEYMNVAGFHLPRLRNAAQSRKTCISYEADVFQYFWDRFA